MVYLLSEFVKQLITWIALFFYCGDYLCCLDSPFGHLWPRINQLISYHATLRYLRWFRAWWLVNRPQPTNNQIGPVACF